MAEQDLVTIYQHRAESGPDRYFCDTQVPNNYGWGDGVMLFRAYATHQPGTVPIYRHEASKPDRYFYDTAVHNNYGWGDGVELCYAYPTQQPGTVPIYQHEATVPDRYFLDTQVANGYGWSQGATLCYAFPVVRTLIDDIVGVLAWQGAKYRGVTYEDTSDNTFTRFDTPRLWNAGPTVTPPIQACKDFLQAITATMASAKSIVDIALLWQTGTGLPGGSFQQALGQGFKSLASSTNLLVRIMIGVPLGPVVLDKDLRAWLEATLAAGNQKPGNVGYTIVVGCCKQSPESWNHSKIIAADDARAIVGGHNLWSKDYLGTSPVHDVSGLIEGSVVACAHSFCDALWSKPAAVPEVMILHKGKYTYGGNLGWQTRPPAPRGKGNTRVLALGRLGYGIASELTVATNASVSARVIALCRAQKTIRISQQSLYFSATGLDGGFDFYTLWAIVKALEAGVTVQIVVSNDVPLRDGGYAGNLEIVLGALTALYVADRLRIFSIKLARDDTYAWASAALTSPIKGIPITVPWLPSKKEYAPVVTELNSRLSVARLYYAPSGDYWQVGKSKIPAANHAKVYIIDDTHFYVGSDNMYLSGTSHGLQEYGHLIEDQAATQSLIANYWDKLWANSGAHVVPATVPPFVLPTAIHLEQGELVASRDGAAEHELAGAEVV